MHRFVAVIAHALAMTATERSEGGSEHLFPSTQWKWKRVKITGAPEATQTARRRRSFSALSRWDPRTPLPMKVKYRGGPECWYEIHARGAMVRVPGHISIHDAMEILYGGKASSWRR